MKKKKDFYYNKKTPRCKSMELNEKGYPIYKDSKKSVHRRIAWIYLLKKSRPLEKWEEVHHVDGDKLNYSPDNLMIFSKEDHWKISRRLNKERNLNKANLFIFLLALMLFLKENPNNEDWGVFFLGILLIIGLLISSYQNFFDWIIRKTKLYKAI